MSIDNGWKACALCGELVNDNDSDRVRYDEEKVIGVKGPMHVSCFDAAVAEVEAERFANPCDGCAGKGWRWQKGAKSEDDGEDCPDCNGTGIAGGFPHRECALCHQGIAASETPVWDLFGEPNHARCYENDQQNRAERAYERALSGDSGAPSMAELVERQAEIQRTLK